MISQIVLNGCLRCNGPLNLYDRFPKCVNCGWEDYRNSDESSMDEPFAHPRTAESFSDSVAYRGQSRRFNFSDNIDARLAAKWRDTILLCPYDGAVMRHSGPASARNPTVQTYTCRNRNHRVRL